MSDRDFEELSAGHALHALTPEEERALTDALAADPARRALVDADADSAALLAETVTEVVPPPALRDALLARIVATPQDAPDVTPDETSEAALDVTPDAAPDVTGDAAPAVTPDAATAAPAASPVPARRGWGPRAWFALAASIALVLVVGGAVTVVSSQLALPASVVALERIESASDARVAAASLAGGGEATLHWSESLGEAVLVSDGLPSISSDQTFELWYVRDGAAISAGLFSAEGDDATAVLSGTVRDGDVVAVTVEPAGGSPDGAPTTDPIVTIDTA
ncbi:anti-sigma factor domain-containing protein [Microbacterium sp. 18062]|uniref:anti-sigma factor n=1 Tax=Microbacterium sp. 18062 TaxID=2681410 RepID=UPI001358DB2F|nr:anti-sigma factor [Microbacterium sp. 18062]